ncbi:hypothetical protein [Dyella caseinilytica]|uniref:Phage replication protein O n=1 Tax=Dyella caseinilytica TaxID=1849581 RepID=A0ABX7GXP9_9GAMM|nr:hypothetical protein [Dyella caseinilytica]QRN55234.1 hypothetical protein ISN74_07865 [Dyella caseinilytica]GGA00296.1 hypothetical protein GCM10011408_21500 [Dyella caseinilytica]
MDWFRLYNEFATDPKVQMMSEAMQRRLVMLFCLQCSNGIETFHETERETSIAFALRISVEEIAATKNEFLRRGFIHEDWTLRNWSKRQYASDSSTVRVRKHRETKKQDETLHETNKERSGNALEQNRTDTEQKENARTRSNSAVSFKTWIESIPEGENAIPVDDPVYAYAERVGLPEAFLRLQWAWFKEKYLAETKRQKSWPQKFRNAVEGGWGNLWKLAPDGQYFLTTQGQQLKRDLDGRAT